MYEGDNVNPTTVSRFLIQFENPISRFLTGGSYADAVERVFLLQKSAVSIRMGFPKMSGESPGRLCEHLYPSIYKSTFDNKCIRPIVRALNKAETNQSCFGVM